MRDTATPVLLPLNVTSTESRARFVIADGTLEALKWLSLVLMVADHINKYFYAERLPGVFSVGRIVMPIFGFVLVYNLARADALQRGVHIRVMVRLAIWGLAATPACIMLNATVVAHYPWWPLSILFTLLLVAGLTYLIEKGHLARLIAAFFLFILAGCFVEYLWFGVLCCLGAWMFCRHGGSRGLILWSLGTLSLTVINGNPWALASMPILLLASRVVLKLPRLKWAFYALYPVHLFVLAGFTHYVR